MKQPTTGDLSAAIETADRAEHALLAALLVLAGAVLTTVALSHKAEQARHRERAEFEFALDIAGNKLAELRADQPRFEADADGEVTDQQPDAE